MSGYEGFVNAASRFGVAVLVAGAAGMLLCVIALSAYTILRGRSTGRRGRVVTDHRWLFPFASRSRQGSRTAVVSKRKILIEKDTEISDESLVDGTATVGERLMYFGVIAFMACFYLVFVGIGLWMFKDFPLGLMFPVVVGFWFFGNMRTFWRDRQRAEARVAARRVGLPDSTPAFLGEGESQEDEIEDREPPARGRATKARGRSGRFWDRNVRLVVGAVWLLVGLGILAGGVFELKLNQRYARDGVTVEGVVLTHSVDTTRHYGRQSTTSTSYDVTYRFQTPDGVPREGAEAVDQQLWNSLREQGPIEIEYLADDPSRSRVADRSPWTIVVILGAVGGAFALFGGGLVGFDVRRRLRARGESTARSRHVARRRGS